MSHNYSDAIEKGRAGLAHIHQLGQELMAALFLVYRIVSPLYNNYIYE